MRTSPIIICPCDSSANIDSSGRDHRRAKQHDGRIMKIVVRILISAMASALMVVGLSAPSQGATQPSTQSAHPTQQQQERAQKKIETLTTEELIQLGQEQAEKQKAADGSTEMQPLWSWPSYTFSHSATVRMWKAVKAGGVTAAAGICALLAPTGPIGRVLAAGGCAVVASFLSSYAYIPSNKCVNVNLRLSSKLVTC